MRLATCRHLMLVLLAATSVVVAGCGSDDGDSSKSGGADRSADRQQVDDSTNETSAGAPAPIDAKLEIEMKNVASKDFSGVPIPKALKCTRSSPATCGGTVECPAADDAPPTAFRICAWLALQGRDILLAKEGDGRQACTMQYGGPEVATVVGTLDGERVDATFSREDGCAINRWDLAAPLWTGDVPPEDPTAGAGGPASGSCLALPPDTPVASDQPAPEDGAADAECAVPATPAPGAGSSPGSPPVEPEIISDPPEAFEID